MASEINKGTSLGAPLILNVLEGESHLIPGGVEEWEGAKRFDVFMGKREQPKKFATFQIQLRYSKTPNICLIEMSDPTYEISPHSLG